MQHYLAILQRNDIYIRMQILQCHCFDRTMHVVIYSLQGRVDVISKKVYCSSQEAIISLHFIHLIN